MTLKTPQRAVGIVTLVAVLFVATTLLAQQLAPTPQQQAIAKLVVQMIEREHISRHEVDDKVSGKLDDKFIKDLDPQKLYFYQRDIEDFNVSRSTLDDALRTGNIDFAYKVF